MINYLRLKTNRRVRSKKKKSSKKEILMLYLTSRKCACRESGARSKRPLPCARIRTIATALIKKKKITRLVRRMIPALS